MRIAHTTDEDEDDDMTEAEVREWIEDWKKQFLARHNERIRKKIKIRDSSLDADYQE